MNNIDTIPNYILLAYLLIISLWGTYKLTRPYKPEKDKTECKCAK